MRAYIASVCIELVVKLNCVHYTRKLINQRIFARANNSVSQAQAIAKDILNSII